MHILVLIVLNLIPLKKSLLCYNSVLFHIFLSSWLSGNANVDHTSLSMIRLSGNIFFDHTVQSKIRLDIQCPITFVGFYSLAYIA